MQQRVLFFGLLALVSVPAPAADFYDVEVLVFRQIDSQDDNEELDVPSIRHLELTLELQDDLKRTPAILLEPAIEGYLNLQLQHIANSRNYEILFYGRWSQTTSDRKAAPYIRIELPTIGRSHALTGALRLFSTDLLYVDAFLRYKPAQQSINQASGLLERNPKPYYFLKERRRVKFREVHFLDHPKFGVLLTVWPVKLPELLSPIYEPKPVIKTNPETTPSILPSSSEP